jgi:adhesin transport system outer membrane protein
MGETMGKTSKFIACAAALVAASTHAQALPEPLLQAARQAVSSNPEVQARWHGFLAADETRNVARGGFFPRVDLDAGIGRERRDTPLLDHGSYSVNGVRLTLTQLLFDGGFTRSEVDRLGYAKLTRYYELLDASETAALEAVRAYMDVVRYRELVEIAKQNYAAHKQTVGLVDERTRAGVGRGVDAEQAAGRLALAESNLLTELTNLHDVSARYLRIVGTPPPEVMPAVPVGLKVGTLPATTAVLLGEGLVANPSVNAAYENVRAHAKGIATARAAYAPRLDLRAYTSSDRNRTTIEPPAGRTRIDGVELVLNYNLFRGGADQAREREAAYAHAQSRDLLEKACRDARQTLQIAYSDVNALAEQMSKLDRHRTASEKAHVVYRQQYHLGQRTLLDLLDSQNEFFQADRAYFNAHYNQVVAQARTLAAMGRLVPALNVGRAGQPDAAAAGQDRGGLDAAQLCPLDTPVVDSLERIKAAIVVPPAPVVQAAPVPAPLPAKVSMQADALFDFDRYDLKPEGQQALDQLLAGMKGADVEAVVVVGHTDSIGTDGYNLGLSQRRAATVRDYLASHGLDARRIRSEGRGESQPVADNATAAGRAKNRRVEIHVDSKK